MDSPPELYNAFLSQCRDENNETERKRLESPMCALSYGCHVMDVAAIQNKAISQMQMLMEPSMRQGKGVSLSSRRYLPRNGQQELHRGSFYVILLVIV